jgi:cardiolipin synthase
MFDRVWTVPNLISLVRLACAPLFLWLLFGADKFWAATILLAVLGASDWIDGWVARRFDQGSELGKLLDPTADRVLLLTAAVALIVDDRIPQWYGILMLAREVVVALFTLALAAAGARRIDVLWVGKAGTFCTMFSFPAFLAASITHGTAHDAFWVIAWVFAVQGLVLSYYAAVRYAPEARRALREGRTHGEVVSRSVEEVT